MARIGAEVRAAREQAELSQAAVADMFGWERDAISKIERGVNSLTLYDYLRLMTWLRDELDPAHPALALAERLLNPRHKPPLRVVR